MKFRIVLTLLLLVGNIGAAESSGPKGIFIGFYDPNPFQKTLSNQLLESFPEQYPFKKVIIWGHKLHSHTHSYIHWAFYRTFKHLGYDTYWFDNSDDVRGFDFSGSLFITEGQVDQKMPVRDDCRYILHNCDGARYKSLKDKDLCICLQVYTHDCLPRKVEEVDDFIFVDRGDRCIYMPWATDLLPHEIDAQKERIQREGMTRSHIIHWVGTSSTGEFGNIDEINAFRKAAAQHGLSFKFDRNLSMEDNIRVIQASYVAPALQGAWQVKNGYIPCRIFKNISYGKMGVTNSETVSRLFKGKIVYNPDCYRLCYDAVARVKNMSQDDLFELMDLVRTKHTYINRIHWLLWFLNEVKAIA